MGTKDSYEVDGLKINRLTLRTLPDLDDGELEAAFNLAIAQLAKSVCDDFGLDKPRKMTLEIVMRPGRKSGQVEVMTTVGAVKVPGLIQQLSTITLTENGEVSFVTGGDRKDPEQRTIFEKGGQA